MERLFLLANRTADWDLGINQDDANEKIEQIQMMTDIYRCAAFTAIWLGEKTDEAKQSFPYLLLGRRMLPFASPIRARWSKQRSSSGAA